MTVKALIESGSKPIDREHPLGLLLRSSAYVSFASPLRSSIYVASNDGEFIVAILSSWILRRFLTILKQRQSTATFTLKDCL